MDEDAQPKQRGSQREDTADRGRSDQADQSTEAGQEGFEGHPGKQNTHAGLSPETLILANIYVPTQQPEPKREPGPRHLTMVRFDGDSSAQGVHD